MNRLAKALTHNRDRRYKHLLDVMPIYVIPIFLLLFAIVVAGGVVIAVLVGPPVYAKVHTEIMNPKVVGPFLVSDHVLRQFILSIFALFFLAPMAVCLRFCLFSL